MPKKNSKKFFVRYIEVLCYATLYNFFFKFGKYFYFYHPPYHFYVLFNDFYVSPIIMQ